MRGTALQYPWAIACLIWIVLQRFYQALRYTRDASTIVFQRDLLYRVPSPFLERCIVWIASIGRARPRVIFDVDDAIYLAKGGSESLAMKEKILAIAGISDAVIAGNAHLRGFFATHPNVQIIPTTVDLSRYVARPAHPNGKATIVWTGVASNIPSLQLLFPVLSRLASETPFTLRIVCDAGTPNPFPAANFPVELIGWSETSEVESLQGCSIGIMPLEDSEWSRGKCGFKLLQYMALGIPAVASAVGANTTIIENGKNGFLATTDDDWLHSLRLLLQDSTRAAHIAAQGRETVEQHFSTSRHYPEFRIILLGYSVDAIMA